MKNIVEFPDQSLIEEEASEWVVRFEGENGPTQKDIGELQAWMDQSPRHREVLIECACLWNDMSLLSELKMPIAHTYKSQIGFGEKLKIWLMAPIMLLIAVGMWLCRQVAVFTSHRRAVFASLVVAVSASFVVWQVVDPNGSQDNLYVTDIGESISVDLIDGSTLWLNTGSEVVVEYSEAKRRISLRRGEAYFKVAHDPSRPFEVYAGARMIRAVGTAFSVYRENDSNVKVTVTEGKVDLAIVTVALDEAGVIDEPVIEETSAMQNQNAVEVFGTLEAGESAILAEDELVQIIVSHEQQELKRRLSWREGRLVFAGESLEEVVQEVSRYTHVHIEIVSPELRNMRVGGQFKVGETDALFDVLESGFGVRVSHLDDQHVQIHAIQ